jgi:hypothetical protein
MARVTPILESTESTRVVDVLLVFLSRALVIAWLYEAAKRDVLILGSVEGTLHFSPPAEPTQADLLGYGHCGVHVITRRQLIGLEIQFIAQGPATTVHMRKGMTGG